MRFQILGPVEVWDGDRAVAVGGPRQRALLAVLLLNANRLVSAERLMEFLWGEEHPPTARASVHNGVARLRRVLPAAGLPDSAAGPADGQALLTRPPGYLLRVPAGALDVDRFDELAAAARTCARQGSAPELEQAGDLLAQALALWRGPALAGIALASCQAEAGRLEERRLAAVEERIDVELRLGRCDRLVGELRSLVATHPLRERFWAQLMLALHGAGRQADALAAFRELRRILVAELAVEPDPCLQRLHQAILAGGGPWEAYWTDRAAPAAAPRSRPATPATPPTPAAPAAPKPEAGAGSDRNRGGGVPARRDDGRPTPREVPPGVYGFTGRAAELARLDAMLAEARTAPAVVISAIAGTAGVGKTALAVHWAHRVADRFDDGQLYVDLRGYDPDRPMHPAEALAGFLRALGVEGREIPPALAERAARYRSLLTGRRMLVVLDNANTAEQVRPLLPGSTSCLVLVTSRDSLAGLVARDGARRIDLDLLTPSEAAALVRTLIGDRVDAEPAAAAALAEQCARLPLALRLAAEMAAQRPARSLADLVAELADERHRLDLLQPGDDDRSAVRTVFSWSYRQLSAETARMFRLFGLHPGVDLDAYAAAALAGHGLPATCRALDVLTRAHLITESVSSRYRMHDLLRAYAAERAQEEARPDRRAALARLLEHYLQTAAAAMNVLYPAERHLRPEVPHSATPAALASTDDRALAWLEAERANLVAATGLAAGHGWPTLAGRLAATLYRYLDLAGHYGDALSVHGHALRAAQDHGDQAGEATAHLGIGAISYYVGRYDDAHEHDRQAAAGFRRTGDRCGEARALGQLGRVYAQWGRHDAALEHYQQALAICHAIDERVYAATYLGWVGLELGRSGRYDEAIGHLRRAIAAHRRSGYRMRVVEALINLGEVCLWAGRHAEALAATREALATSEYRFLTAYALNVQAEVHRALGQADEALAQYRAALATAREISRRDERARALDGIGHVLHSRGQPDQARRHWQEALHLYSALHMPEADTVRTHLATLDRAAAVALPGDGRANG